MRKGQQEGSPSKLTKKSGVFFGQGYINGINSMLPTLMKTAKNFADTSVKTLKKNTGRDMFKSAGRKFMQRTLNGLQPAADGKKKTQTNLYNAGKKITENYAKGVTDGQSELQTAVKGMVTTVLTTMMDLTKFNFSKVAEKAGSQFGTELSKKITYINNKAQYQSEQKAKQLEKKLSKYETDKKTAQSNYKATNTKLKSTEKSLTSNRKKYATAEENYKRAAGKYNSATKATQKASYKEQMQKYKKQMETYKKEADADKKSIAALKKKKAAYKQAVSDNKKLIKDQKAFNEAYTTASSQMLSEFSEALSDYQTKAQELIDETINGIETKYQERYDALIEKQNTLISKLKSAGDLFEVSGAGIMTVNDLKTQTQNIRDYADKLQKIKSKVSSELFDQIAGYDMDQGSAFMDRLLAMDDLELKAYVDAYDEKMRVSEELGKKTYQKDLENVEKEYKTALETAFKDLPKKMEELGKQAMAGFTEGLTTNTDYMAEAVKSVVSDMVEQVKTLLDIHSPSKVM